MDELSFEDLDIELPDTNGPNGGFPASTYTQGYDPVAAAAKYQVNRLKLRDEYHYDKVIGLRRSNGHVNLKKLRPVHERMIALHINGVSGADIALQFKCSAFTVYRILGDPLAASLIAEVGEHYREEFKQLFPLVYKAVKEGLENPSSKVRLASVDRFARINRMIDGDSDEDGTEKYVKRVIDARTTIVNLILNATPREAIGEVIENESLEGENPDVEALDAPCLSADNMVQVPSDLTADDDVVTEETSAFSGGATPA